MWWINVYRKSFSLNLPIWKNLRVGHVPWRWRMNEWMNKMGREWKSYWRVQERKCEKKKKGDDGEWRETWKMVSMKENLIKTFSLRLVIPFRKLLSYLVQNSFPSKHSILLSPMTTDNKAQKMIHIDAYHVSCCFWQQKDTRNVHWILIP